MKKTEVLLVFDTGTEHTHMEVDSKQATINRAMKRQTTNTIFTINDHVNRIASCKKR